MNTSVMKAFQAIRSRLGLFCFAAAFCAWGIGPVGRVGSAGSGLRHYHSLVVSDSQALFPFVASPSSGVRVTYLGTNGYLLEASDSTILIDPYFSRIALAPVASNSPIKPNIIRINSGMNRLPRRIDAILVTHGHFDHLLDVPEIARRTRASVVASPTSCYLSQAVGVPPSKTLLVRAGDSVRCGGARVHVLAAVHRSHFWHTALPWSANRGAAEAAPAPVRLGLRRATCLSARHRRKAHLCGRRRHGGHATSNDCRAC